MTSFRERVGQVLSSAFQKIKDDERQTPVTIPIPPERVDIGASLTDPLAPEQHYFQVIVNELYLTKSREWTRVIDPAVLVVSEFSYAGQRQSVPVLVGPALVERSIQQVPNGMVFYDTRVAGPHPYRGGQLTLSVVLYKATREDYARKMLALVERAASALSSAVQLGPYLKVADVVLGGVELLLSQQSLVPLAGLRSEFNPDGGAPLRPGYFVLLDPPDDGPPVDTAKLWVRERRLCYGDSLATAASFREADYVLYSLTRGDERSDLSELPFDAIYQQMSELAVDPARKDEAKVTAVELQRALVKSPDLTRAHRQRLIKTYMDELKSQLEGVLGGPTDEEAAPATPEAAEQQASAAEALEILKL
jgi:hypothetical protein